MKRTLDIEDALHWTYQDQMPKLGEEWGGKARYAPMFKPGSLARSCGTTFSFSDPIPPASDEPHPDALEIACAVDKLEGQGFGFDASLRAAELAPECFRYIEPGDPVLSHFMIAAAPLVAMHARLGTRPEWRMAIEARRVVASTSGQATIIRSGRAPHGKGVYGSGDHCPLEIVPNPIDIVSDRAEYECWVMALRHLAVTLANRLASIDVQPPTAPLRPWIDGERTPTILRDLTKNWDPPAKPRRKGRGTSTHPLTSGAFS